MSCYFDLRFGVKTIRVPNIVMYRDCTAVRGIRGVFSGRNGQAVMYYSDPV